MSSPAKGSECIEDRLTMLFRLPVEQYRDDESADVRKSARDAKIVRLSVETAEISTEVLISAEFI
jgi:hypothetical protein